MAAMVGLPAARHWSDYQRCWPEIVPGPMFLGDLGQYPTLANAPPFIKDALVFPYLVDWQLSRRGAERPWLGFAGRMFEKPPASTQQFCIRIYGRAIPCGSKMPAIDKVLGNYWAKLAKSHG